MRRHHDGFSLIEMLLVTVAISAIFVMFMRFSQQKVQNMQVDHAALQMQQILAAAMAFKVNNNSWPTSVTNLTTTGYLSGTKPIVSPWGTAYTINSTNNIFSVTLNMPTGPKFDLLAKMIAGKLPFATVKSFKAAVPANSTAFNNCIAAHTQPNGTIYLNDQLQCSTNNPTVPAQPAQPGGVVASVNIPGQDLNNASAINFAGIYHHGACVPMPRCPAASASAGALMTPRIMVLPVSVSGLNDSGSNNVYPLSSFTAYATGPAISSALPQCTTGATVIAANCGTSPSGRYWRACLQIITERGMVNDTTTNWGNKVALAVFTRCEPSSESSGSDFSVFTD